MSPDDPNHSVTGVAFQIFGTFHPNETVPAAQILAAETMQGFLQEEENVLKSTNLKTAGEVINYLPTSLIPVYSFLAENFVIFDRWFADVPGPTDPNRYDVFLLAVVKLNDTLLFSRAYITSGASHGHGSNDNGFSTFALPQRSIFQQLSENNITWINYFNSSFNPDAEFYSWTKTEGKVATNVKPIANLFADAKAGNLPQFSYINPEVNIHTLMFIGCSE